MQKQILITHILSDSGAALGRHFRENGWYVFGLAEHDNYSYECDRFIRFDMAAFASDVSYRIRMSGIFEELIKQLDALIFQFEPSGELLRNSLDLEYWQKSLDIHLTTPLLLIKLFAERLRERKGYILSLIDETAAHASQSALASLPIREGLRSLTLAVAKDENPEICANVLSYRKTHAKTIQPQLPELAALAFFLCSGQVRMNGKSL